MTDQTPEERAATNFDWVFEGRGPVYVARLADLIREAESSARSKAFEEAAKLCDDETATFLQHAHESYANGDDYASRRSDHRASATRHLAEKIRARAKEAHQ